MTPSRFGSQVDRIGRESLFSRPRRDCDLGKQVLGPLGSMTPSQFGTRVDRIARESRRFATRKLKDLLQRRLVEGVERFVDGEDVVDAVDDEVLDDDVGLAAVRQREPRTLQQVARFVVVELERDA